MDRRQEEKREVSVSASVHISLWGSDRLRILQPITGDILLETWSIKVLGSKVFLANNGFPTVPV